MRTGGRLVVHQSHFKDLTHSLHWRFDRVGREERFAFAQASGQGRNLLYLLPYGRIEEADDLRDSAYQRSRETTSAVLPARFALRHRAVQ
jgi:hypothetical protein